MGNSKYELGYKPPIAHDKLDEAEGSDLLTFQVEVPIDSNYRMCQ